MMASLSPVLHETAHLLTLRVIQSLAEGTLIGLFAAAVLRVSRNNASTRFAIWFSSLVAIACVPVVSGEWLWHTSAGAETHAVVTLPDSWAVYLLAVWMFISAWFLLGVVRSIRHLRVLRKSCVEINPTALDDAVRNTIEGHRTKRRVAICTSAQVGIPTAIGLIQPAVVIPDWALQELSPDELRQILLHELAHLHRWDDWTNLGQQLVKAIFFFHPVVWWIDREAALERELACDDAVLAETASPRTYAECLARMAEKSFVRRSVALTQTALGRIRQITERVTRILDPHRPSGQGRALKPAVVIIAVFSLACGVWSSRGSRLIAFRNSAPAGSAVVALTHSPVAPVHSPMGNKFQAVARSATQSAVVTPVRLKLESPMAKRNGHRSAPRAPLPASAAGDGVIVLAKSSATTVPVTETVFVVIQDRLHGASAGELCQIRLWRVMVLRTVVQPAPLQTSRKQI